MMGTTERSGPADGGLTLWLTGLSGAGKTTLALALERELAPIGYPTCVLDGDELRKGLTSDLGLSREDRSEQARRAAHVAALIARSGVIAIVALISPYGDDRRNAREIHEQLGLPFFEVWVDTPVEICERRDPKGLYARARAGQLHDFTGLDAPYERPVSPDLKIEGYDEDPTLTARQIVELLGVNDVPLDALTSIS
jgi:bifunctional enzyme CysN/CysC